jgi:hypothetical protein
VLAVVALDAVDLVCQRVEELLGVTGDTVALSLAGDRVDDQRDMPTSSVIGRARASMQAG